MTVLFALLTMVGVSLLRALILQWLWNIVVVNLFAAPDITFLYAWGLMAIVSLLLPAPINYSQKEIKS